jgi:hypothetical protein
VLAGGRPARRLTRRFDGVADVLAIALAHFSDESAGGRKHGAGIASIGPGLLAADVELGGTVDITGGDKVAVRFGGRRLNDRLGLGQPFRLAISRQPLTTAFTAKAGLLVAAEADAGIEQIGGVDPDHAAFQLRRDVQRQAQRFGPD